MNYFFLFYRYISSSRAFTSNMLRENRISQYDHDVLLENCKTFESLLPPINHVIYLKRDAQFCLTNIQTRGRPGEGTITKEYLEGKGCP